MSLARPLGSLRGSLPDSSPDASQISGLGCNMPRARILLSLSQQGTLMQDFPHPQEGPSGNGYGHGNGGAQARP